MKITGGQDRGRIISVSDDPAVRPTASKMRQAFFNILGHKVEDARFLDVFAGSGLMGIEAISRGAKSLTIVEEAIKQIRTIETNLRKLKYRAVFEVGNFRVTLPKMQPKSFDIIYADPPYKSPFGRNTVEIVDKYDLLADDGVLIVEHLRGYDFPKDLKRLEQYDQRYYGSSGLTFFRLKTSPSDDPNSTSQSAD
ncbi:MAG: 16S rRNA (guanine(966)-N(2))-methyltransferase RsmD [Candidatus Obscuribacterales bacterium]|nr:16S rRNA (guanine(966)-N(2))-methyltransferase RsmD [Candidatus Obscuribacterales bacterium]